MASFARDPKFLALLNRLLSSNNEIRSAAEADYETIRDPEKFFCLLSVLSDDSVPIEEAELGAILLRRLIASDSGQVFGKLAPEMQDQIKNQFLLLLQHNVRPHLTRKICHAVAELAHHCIDDEGNNKWPDFLKFLFESAQSHDPFVREIALLMFSSVPGVFGNQQSRYIDVIRQMLSHSLIDSETTAVRYVAVKALSNFILANEKEIPVQKQFTDCLALLFRFFTQVFNDENGQPDEILRHLVELGEACPQFFRGQLDTVLELCVKCAINTDFDDSTRHLALEFIVTLCEAAPVMIKKMASKHIPTILTFTLKMMTDLEDDPDWETSDEDDSDEDNDSTAVIAEASLDRIACALGGKIVLPLILSILPQMLQSPEWRDRSAGLMAISSIGEGCHKQMSAMLTQMVEGVLPFLSDPHNRVIYACCNALGQMSSDFAPTFQKKFHNQAMPALLQLLSNATSPRVQAHAGAALVNFFEDCPKSVLAPYMTNIVNCLEGVLQASMNVLMEKHKKIVLEQVVVTLAALADSAQEKFTDHYEKFMPCLKHIIQNAVQPDLRVFRGKTIECVSLIGLAVGKDKFLSDATEVMDLLLKSQNLAEDDPQLSYMIAAWARLCKIMGQGFKPYLPHVMGPVFKAASIKPEIAVLDADDMKVVGNDNDWEFVNLGEKHNFGIRTAGLEEKATACQMLVCYARDLREGFIDYVEDTVKLMVPMFKFYFHDGVRIAAVEIMPFLLDCAKVKGQEYVLEMWRYILQPILQALENEPEIEVLCEQIDSLSMCVTILNCPCMEEAHLRNVITLLNTFLTKYFERCDVRAAKRKEEEYDDVLEENLEKEDDEDVYLLSKIAQLISAIFSVFKRDFLPYFDMIVHHFIRLIGLSQPWTDCQWGLCVFADVIEHCGPACGEYREHFMSPILRSLRDDNADLRQTASFAVGILAQFGGGDFSPYLLAALPMLVEMINQPTSRSEENERATENAISAITKMFMYSSANVDVDGMLSAWLTWLPVWEDEEEAMHIYGFLFTLLESNNPVLLGTDNCNLPRIVHIIAEAFNKEAIEATSEIGKRAIILIRDIQNNTELFSKCVSHLNPKQQEALGSALSSN